ncbi:MAG: amidase [Gammaproteobacteria bacterium]|nr:amidase [Gammaproteobacteria bacterium]
MSGTLAFMSISEAARRIAERSLSPLELVDALIERSERLDPILNAYLLPTFEQAREAARAAETSGSTGGQDRGPLHGIPFGLKDIIDTAGIRTTCHSKILENNIPREDAEVARRLKSAGAILMGKLSTHEFAFGGPSFDLPWPPARNPWNIAHHPGGSSSGSGAAVASGMLPLALGSDTGGSVRNPSSCCGLVGIKPTYGLVPRSGVFPLAYSLDNIGPMTRTVEDNALVLQTLAGPCPRDPASAQRPVDDFRAGLSLGVKGLRIGILEHFHTEDMQAETETAAAIQAVADVLRSLGASVEPTRVQPLQTYAAGNRILLTVEGYAVHRRWLTERPQDYAAMTREKLLPGAFISGPDYVDALRLRTRLRDEFERHMAHFDALICVSSMEPPCRIDDAQEVARTYPRQARAPFNFLGCPALVTPCGFHSSGLPLSVQWVGKAFDEPMLYRIAAAYERETGWTDRHPSI